MTAAIPVITQKIDANEALRIGEDFVADHLGDQIGVGAPWRVVSSVHSAWVVPLLLTSPGYGVVGTVGVLVVDEEFGHITAWPTVEEIDTNAERLVMEKKEELDAAFERDWDKWDKQTTQDSESGKLDFLIDEALAEKNAGKLLLH
jgi:hypothetical protein